jgi:hypothetical protein
MIMIIPVMLELLPRSAFSLDALKLLYPDVCFIVDTETIGKPGLNKVYIIY